MCDVFFIDKLHATFIFMEWCKDMDFRTLKKLPSLFIFSPVAFIHHHHHVWHMGPFWKWWMPLCPVSLCYENSPPRSRCFPVWKCQWLYQLLLWLPSASNCWSAIWNAAFKGEKISLLVAVLQWRDLQLQTGTDMIRTTF